MAADAEQLLDRYRTSFGAASDDLGQCCAAEERVSIALAGEVSDFVRFNRGRIRQAGAVAQARATVTLIRHGCWARHTVDLSGEAATDRGRCRQALHELRMMLPDLPPDPLLPAPEVAWTSDSGTPALEHDAHAAAADIIGATQGLDLVGHHASGALFHGYADSAGSHHWHCIHRVLTDWSLYDAGGHAVKNALGGDSWQADAFSAAIGRDREDLARLAVPAVSISPGTYRAFLAPTALEELMSLLAWDAFGVRALQTGHSPMAALAEGKASLAPTVTVHERGAAGQLPPFTQDGRQRPAEVALVTGGRFDTCLAGARHACEFGVPVTGDSDAAEALDMAPGLLAAEAALEALDTGLLIHNLWYANHADRNTARITGMTRFGCFWVAGGGIQGPIEPMRFDDSLYRLLGDNLEGITRETQWLPDRNTYGGRARRSLRLPGVLTGGLRLAL